MFGLMGETAVTALPVTGSFFDWASAAHENRKEANRTMITYFNMVELFSITYEKPADKRFKIDK